MRTRKVFLLTNIPSPYRVGLFNGLAQQFHQRGWQLIVIFLAQSESGRHWALETEKWAFDYRFLKGPSFLINFSKVPAFSLHFKFGLINLLWKERPQHLIIGGYLHPSYYLSLLYRPFLNYRLSMWMESWSSSVSINKGLIPQVRRWAIAQADTYCIPGRKTHEFIEATLGKAIENRYVWLYNSIPGQNFPQRQPGPSQGRFVASIRFNHRKGLDLLVEAFLQLPLETHWSLDIYGAGPLEESCRQKIKQAGYDQRICFKEFLPWEEAIQRYVDYDIMVLPSRKDPNPLINIEASTLGLYLVCTQYAGNAPELLQNPEVGQTIDPLQLEHSFLPVLRHLIETPPYINSERIRAVSEQFWDQANAQRFVEQFLKINS